MFKYRLYQFSKKSLPYEQIILQHMNLKRKRIMKVFKVTLFTLFCFPFLFQFPQAQAQNNELNRISAVERSDGNGYVVRFHLSAMVDSFKVYRPSENLIQMKLYAEGLDTVNLRKPDYSSVFPSIETYTLPSGVAVDISIGDENYFNTNIYPDQNQKDLLLALTSVERNQLSGVVEGLEPLDWRVYAYDNISDSEFEFFSDEEINRMNGSSLDVVVIDAGHGGRDPGAIGIGRIREKDIALKVALKVGEYIEQHIPDLKVVYTRTDDTYIGLPERGKIANENNGDLFVSIHTNSFAHRDVNRQRSANGAEVYFLGMARSQSALEVMKRENAVVRFDDTQPEELTEEDLLIYELTNAGNMRTSEEFAVFIEQQFRERAQRRSRGVKQAGLQVLYEATMPGVLIELGFISNPDEARYLNTEYGQTIVASAIFRAIRDFKLRYDKSQNRQTSSN